MLTRRTRDVVALVGRTRAFQQTVDFLYEVLPATPGTLAVLTYHRVDWPSHRPWLYPGLISATPVEFRRQLAWIRRRLRPVSMAEVLEAKRTSACLPARSVLVTFDDAYRDFTEHAWPALANAGVPATLFVPTEAAGMAMTGFWWDRVYEALLTAATSPMQRLDTPFGAVPVATRHDRARGMRWLLATLKAMDHEDAMGVVASLTTDRGSAGEDRRSTLTWAQLRQLRSVGLTVAPHTRSHALLPKVPPERARAEVESSRDELRREVPGSLDTVLAYPSGQYDDRVVSIVRDLGFELAFTTDGGVNVRGESDPLRLRRINVGARATPAIIGAQIMVASVAGRRRDTRQAEASGSWSG